MPAPDRLLHFTTSLCRVCKEGVPARVVATPDGAVWMKKTCPTHGDQAAQLSTNAEWYERTRAWRAPPAPPPVTRKAVDHGCPFDCGPCESHTQKIRLPVVTITSSCDLDCPICYVHNKNQGAFHMDRAEFQRVLDHLVADHGGALDLINFTGGEPMEHPGILEFLAMCQAVGIHRVSLCSNGIRLARDEELVRQLAAVGGRVALSFDSFEPEADYALQGAHMIGIKRRCLDLLEKHGVDTTLIPVMTKGYNDHEIGRIIDLGLSRSNVRHIEVHTITYTGQSGVSFDRSGRISTFEVLERIAETTPLRIADFVPSPCAHPLCYQVAYLLVDPDGGPPVPFSRFLPPEIQRECLGERLYLEPTPALERAFLDAIDRLWAEGAPEGSGIDADRTMAILKGLLKRMFPRRPLSRAESLRVSERAVKAVYVHSHMDEETFDTERAAQCCASNCYADGTTIPVCNYNVLYREKEPRFMTRPRQWGARAGGRRDFSNAAGHPHESAQEQPGSASPGGEP